MKRLAENLHRSPLQITPAAMNALVAYDWPGNVRDLENILTQALLRARDTVLTPDLLNLQRALEETDVPNENHAAFRSQDGLLLSLDELEAQHIQRTLDETFGHKGKTCEILGISRPALERKIHKYGLQLPRMQ
jgi:DNA-binding NtrC family response regulator